MTDPSTMNPEPNTLTRREALLRAFKGAVVTSLAGPLVADAGEPPSQPAPEFVMENDYPFFGPEPVASVPLARTEHSD